MKEDVRRRQKQQKINIREGGLEGPGLPLEVACVGSLPSARLSLSLAVSNIVGESPPAAPPPCVSSCVSSFPSVSFSVGVVGEEPPSSGVCGAEGE